MEKKTMYVRCKEVCPPVANRSTTLGVVAAEGCYVFTEDGRKMLDFASGVAVCNLGHRHPKIVEAAKSQIDKFMHVGHNVVYNESYVALAEKLVEITGGDTMVYFSNSGAEANDGAMKLAKYVTKRPGIISFRNAFHGRTIGCTSITTSSSNYRKGYEPLMPAVYFAEYPVVKSNASEEEKNEIVKKSLDSVQTIFNHMIVPEEVAAIILEPVQGEGGYIVPPKSFLEGIRKICDENGIMMIFDEVQSGAGRTGQMYAYQTLGVKPDILTSAKALGGGFPLSAIIAKKDIMKQWDAGTHGGTFGGNPVACATALASIDVMQNDGALENCREMGVYFLDKLRELQNKYPDIISDARGLGLMVAIEIVDKDGNPDGKTEALIRTKAREEKNIILLNAGYNHNIIRFIAPMIVTTKEIDFVVSSLDEIIGELVEESVSLSV